MKIKKIAACLILVLQAAAMLLFTLCGCAPSIPNGEAPSDAPQDMDPAPTMIQPSADERPDAQGQTDERRTYLACLYADPAMEADLAADAKPDAQYALTEAVLLPHYANALGLCCDLLSGIEREVELIVLVGPNHSGRGEAVQISGADWYWSAGQASGDADAARTLAAAAGILSDTEIAQDWSVQTLIPYLARYFPEAKLVTVLLARSASAEALSALAAATSALFARQEVLLVGSVDFSHELDPASAQLNDEKTCAWIEAGEMQTILTLDNGYLDSPETAALVMQVSQARGQSLRKCGGLFERFWDNGKEKAGSYYSFAAGEEP